MILGCCGPAGTRDKSPLLVIDAAYTNYISFTERLGRGIVSMQRHLNENGKHSLPDIEKIENLISG
jgi:aspartate aminotransferase